MWKLSASFAWSFTNADRGPRASMMMIGATIAKAKYDRCDSIAQIRSSFGASGGGVAGP